MLRGFYLPKWRFPTVIFAITLALAGCAHIGGASDANLTPAERQLRDSTDRFNETVATGAIAGAILGALLGALVSSNNPGEGAALGAAAGGALGAGAGYYVASRNESYASAEAGRDARLAAAQKELANYHDIARYSDQVVAENQKKLATLDAQYKNGQIDAKQYRSQVSDVQLMNDRMQKAVSESAKTSQQMNADGLSQESAELDQLAEHIQQNQIELAKSLAAVPNT